LKDFLIWQGIEGITGSRDTIREAFSKGLIEEGQGWMSMLADRNRTSHAYNEETAEAMLGNIRLQHHALLMALEKVLLARVAQKSMNSLPDSGLPAAAIHAICQVFERYPGLAQAVLYGSRAKGTFRPGSDIDLTLKGELSDQELLNLYGDSDDLLLPYKFDLSLYRQLGNPGLLEHIERVGRVFYGKGQEC
jgi:predicted nucleotidyltransferase